MTLGRLEQPQTLYAHSFTLRLATRTFERTKHSIKIWEISSLSMTGEDDKGGYISTEGCEAVKTGEVGERKEDSPRKIGRPLKPFSLT